MVAVKKVLPKTTTPVRMKVVAPVEKKGGIAFVIRTLIAEQKHTDDEIREKVSKKFPDANVGNIGGYRSKINAGKKEKQGFAKPKTPYQKFERIDGKLTAVKEVKRGDNQRKPDVKKKAVKKAVPTPKKKTPPGPIPMSEKTGV